MNGPGVCSGMAGCLVLVLRRGRWDSVWVLTLLMTPPDYWDADDLAMEMEDHPCVWTGREDYPTGGHEVAGAGVDLPAS